MKTVYYISQVDHSMFLVLVLEGKRRPNEKTTQVGRNRGNALVGFINKVLMAMCVIRTLCKRSLKTCSTLGCSNPV